jgi:hypothetical protein
LKPASWIARFLVDGVQGPIATVDAPPTPQATTIVTASVPLIRFEANPAKIKQCGCTQLSWQVEGVKAVYYQGQDQAGTGSKQECPQSTSNFTLNVLKIDGSEESRVVTVEVEPDATCQLPTKTPVPQLPTVIPQTPLFDLTRLPLATPTEPVFDSTSTPTATSFELTSTPTDVPEVPPTATPDPTTTSTATDVPEVPPTATPDPTITSTATDVPEVPPTATLNPTTTSTATDVPEVPPTATLNPTITSTATDVPEVPPTATPDPSTPSAP